MPKKGKDVENMVKSRPAALTRARRRQFAAVARATPQGAQVFDLHIEWITAVPTHPFSTFALERS